MDEKRINSAINVWCRVPALIAVSTFGFIQIHLQHRDPLTADVFGTALTSVRIFLALLASWNGLFFMERVVGNFHVCDYKAKKEAVPASSSRAAASNGNGNGHGKQHAAPPSRDGNGNGNSAGAPFAYDSEDHFGSSLPGVGMRVSVSHQELQEVDGKEVSEAYPVDPKKSR